MLQLLLLTAVQGLKEATMLNVVSCQQDLLRARFPSLGDVETALAMLNAGDRRGLMTWGDAKPSFSLCALCFLQVPSESTSRG